MTTEFDTRSWRRSRVRLLLSLALFGATISVVSAGATAERERIAFERVAEIFEARCTACHSGAAAESEMRLDRESLYRATVNVPAWSNRSRRRVDPGAPERSELFLRLLPEELGSYRGPRMPMEGEPLTDGEIALVREWISSFPQETWSVAAHDEQSKSIARRSFRDSHLALLPTPDAIGDGIMEFRILHRFRESTKGAGSDGLYGLDSGADISFGLTYGMTNLVELGLRRTNYQKDYELFSKIVALSQRSEGSAVSLAFQAGVSVIDSEGAANRTSYSAQMLLGHRFSRRASILIAPTYVTDTNFLDESDRRDTAALGVGGEWRWTPVLSTSLEWIGQFSGVEAPYESASLGFAISTSKHVFHLLLTNTRGMHTDLYAPGGDLGDGEFRLGFNITRRFDVEHRGAVPGANQ